jgi:nucleoside-diphosphate-sugar epimerase
MRIFLTGSNSSIGKRLVQSLQAAGHEVIQAAGRDSKMWKLGQNYPTDIKAEVLIHLAHDRTFTIQENFEALELLTSSFRGYSIFLSSISAHSRSKSIYGQSKFRSEALFVRNHGVALRAGVVHGAYVEGIYSTLQRFVNRLKFVPVPFSGKPRLFTTHIDDLCQEILEILEKRPSGVRLAAHSWPNSLKGLIRHVANVENRRIYSLPVPSFFIKSGLRILEIAKVNNPLVDSLRSLQSEVTLPELSELEPSFTTFRPL